MRHPYLYDGVQRHFRILAAALITLTFTLPASASVIARYNFNSPDTLANSAGETFYQPNMTNPPSPSSPTFLPNGGAFNTGAVQFDGVTNRLDFRGAGYLYIADNFSNWTVSFWIKTTDMGTNLNYAGTPQVPVLGNVTGGIGFGLGVDGGRATYKRYSGGWQTAQGTNIVADGLGHYVTYVAQGSSNLSIYVDGYLDTANLAVPASGFSQLGSSIGRSYLLPTQDGKYGAFTLDDLRVWNEALTLSQIHDQIIPEPSSALCLAAGLLLVLRRRMHHG